MAEWTLRVEARADSGALLSARIYTHVVCSSYGGRGECMGFCVDLRGTAAAATPCAEVAAVAGPYAALYAPERGRLHLYLVRAGIAVVVSEMPVAVPALAGVGAARSACGMPAIVWAIAHEPRDARAPPTSAAYLRATVEGAWATCMRAEFSCIADCAEQCGTHVLALAPGAAPPSAYVLTYLLLQVDAAALAYFSTATSAPVKK